MLQTKNKNWLIIFVGMIIVFLFVSFFYLLFYHVFIDESGNIPNNDEQVVHPLDKEYLYFNYSEKYELKIGGSVQLKAYRVRGSVKFEEEVTWSSSNKGVATVTNGNVKAIKKGTATITAKSKDGLTVKINIIVKDKDVTNIQIDDCGAGINLKVGNTKNLTYTISPSKTSSGTWKSSNSSVLTVSSTGKIEGKKDGTAKITVTVDGKEATCNVNVYSTYNVELKYIYNSDSLLYELSTIVTDHNGTNITEGLTYQWYFNGSRISGATESIYTVYDNGTYKVNIYKNDSLIAISTYTVLEEEGLELNHKDIYELKTGGSVQLKAYRVRGSVKVEEEVTWSSSNKGVATVTNGNVKAIKNGTAIITAKSKDGLTVKINIIVKDKDVTNVQIDDCGAGINLKVGNTKNLTYTISPSKTSSGTWKSSNSSVLTVSSTGKITGIKDGTAKITVTVDGKEATCNVKVYSTYNLQLKYAYSSSSNLYKLSTSVTNHNGTNITEGLTYQWYFNGSRINEAIESTYVVYNNGTYKVEVYKDNSLIATSTYTVLEEESLELNYKDIYELKTGGSVQLKAYRVRGSVKVEEDVTWSSSNESVATVTNGNVKAINGGFATITAKSKDGLIVKINIIVEEVKETSIKINDCESEISLKVGNTKNLTYTISPSKTSSATWKSSNSSVLTVSSTGKITGIKDGTAKITVTVDGKEATCNVNVYSTYSVQIKDSVSNINVNSLVSKTLTTSVTNHNGTNITEGLTYQWYLNDATISGEKYSSYTIDKYGVYKVNVYKDGKLIAYNTYTPSATLINYKVDTSDTKFVFVNNPEAINDADFVDNGKVIYKTTFDKNIEMYFEHNRDTHTPFYYGIRIYNPTSKIINLFINNSGASACLTECTFYSDTWKEYFSENITYRLGENNIKEEYTLTPGQYLYFWFVRDDNMPGNIKFVSTISNYMYAPYNDYLPSDYTPINSSWGWAFDGVLNLTVKYNGKYLSSTGEHLEISNIAVSKSFYNSSNKEKINTVSTLAQKKHGQLTAEYNGKPLVKNNATFVINDSTPSGVLNTYYDTLSGYNTLVSGWVTNISGASPTGYQREMIPLKGINKDGKTYTVEPFGTIVTANYAVQYHENITIKNNGSKNRNVAFYVNTASGTEQQKADTALVSFVTNDTGQIVKNSFTMNEIKITPTATFAVFPRRTNVQVWKATIPPGKSITVPSVVMIGGMSYATLIKMVCVDNVCYDSFYQKNFSW